MTLEIIRDMLGWCTIINTAFLIIWLLMIIFGREFIYRIHSRLLPVSDEHFNMIHYGGMAVFKMMIVTTNLAPYLALRIAG